MAPEARARPMMLASKGPASISGNNVMMSKRMAAISMGVGVWYAGRRSGLESGLVARGGRLVLGSLISLQRDDGLRRAAEDVRDGPAAHAGVGVDLAPMVDVMLDHHHQHAPARERAVAIDHVD